MSEDWKFLGVPNFFKMNCLEASVGGTNSYVSAGWHLANSTDNLYDQGDNKTRKNIDKLVNHLQLDDNEAVKEWYLRYLPNCMKLVPKRRLHQFVKGVFMAYEDERIGY